MKRLRDISLFRLFLFGFAVFYFRSFVLFVILTVFLFLYDRDASPLFVLLCTTIYFLNRYRIDFMPIGIVEARKETYLVVDKLFYKTKLLGADDLSAGDVVFFKCPLKLNEYDSQISKNLLFSGKGDYRVLFRFFPRFFLQKQAERLSKDSGRLIQKLIYNEYPDHLPFEIGPGLSFYYFFKKIRQRSASICLILMFLYYLCFFFDIRFYLIMMDCIFEKADISDIKKMLIKSAVISLINLRLFFNPSFQLAFLLDLYSSFSFQVCFKAYLIFLFSIMFGEFDLIGVLLFEKMALLRLCVLVFSFAVLLIPGLDSSFLSAVKKFSFLNSTLIPIRGSLSFLGLVIFLLLCKKWKLRKSFLQVPLLIVIIILPIHHPFAHISFVDVGQGDAIMIRRSFVPSCVLVDTGSIYNYSKLKKKLSKEGIYVIDSLIITHDDSDHNGNIERLKRDFKIKEIVDQGRDMNYGSYEFDYLGLDPFDNDNDNSIVYKLKAGKLSVFLTGDISIKAERELIRKHGPLTADILKVSHHGSRSGTGEEFLSETLPDIAIISTSGQYGHPHAETIERLDRYGVKWYTTKEHGSMDVYINSFFAFLASAKNDFVIIRS